jgi:hypothetical protein
MKINYLLVPCIFKFFVARSFSKRLQRLTVNPSLAEAARYEVHSKKLSDLICEISSVTVY